MKKSIIYTILIVIIALIVYTIINYNVKPGKYDDFAKCLTEKGAVMAGTDWCSYCKKQKEAFGKSFKYIDYKNCDFEKTWCDENGVEGYPTWVIDGETYSGVQSMERLGSLTGCEA